MKLRTCRLPVIAGTALLALAASEPAAHAQRVTFTYTGKVVTYTVPTTGLYQITAYGAQGGNGVFNGVGPGGLGAEISRDFTLTAGETLEIAVGGTGVNAVSCCSGGGGGGGSFVVGPGNTPLVIAGGGGGGGGNISFPVAGGGGLTSLNGGNAPSNGGAAGIYGNGGTDGNGGTGGSGSFGGGGGFLTSGGDGTFHDGSVSATGGGAFPGLAGGSFGGGFGGGGGASGGAGGGGGYSGGRGGASSPGGRGPGGGGGGGTFGAGTDQIMVANFQTGDGEVVINTIFVGTPGEPNCHGDVVSNLAKQYGGLDAAAAALGYSSVQALQNDIAEYCAGTIG